MILEIALIAILLGWVCNLLADLSYDGSANYTFETRPHHWFTLISFILWGIGIISLIVGVWKL